MTIQQPSGAVSVAYPIEQHFTNGIILHDEEFFTIFAHVVNENSYEVTVTDHSESHAFGRAAPGFDDIDEHVERFRSEVAADFDPLEGAAFNATTDRFNQWIIETFW